jgi:hypothetical protein
MTDRPHLVGWGSLHHARRRSPMSPVVIASTAAPVPTGGKLGQTHTLRCKPALDPRDLDHHHAAPCGTITRAIGTPSVVSMIDRVSPTAGSVCALRIDCAVRSRASFSPRSRHHTRQRECGELLGQRRTVDLPCGSSCVTTRDASDRLLPSHVLRTSTRAS